MRKAIATALQKSKAEIPHFYATIAIDMTAALALKDTHAAAGVKLSVNDIISRGVVLALADEPRMSCRVGAAGIEYPEDVHHGIAVGTEDGLLVPVVLKAQKLDLAALAAESRRVIEAARSGKLVGMGQGTFTISNLGVYGVESFTAIINPPEGAILAVGAARLEAVPHAGGFVPRSILRVTLSSDHRAIDGVLAARFLARLQHVLEDASRL
jgi:pyruvate dehydrogenase E2 component (dihydrolipoamide acetyltransferase)